MKKLVVVLASSVTLTCPLLLVGIVCRAMAQEPGPATACLGSADAGLEADDPSGDIYSPSTGTHSYYGNIILDWRCDAGMVSACHYCIKVLAYEDFHWPQPPFTSPDPAAPLGQWNIIHTDDILSGLLACGSSGLRYERSVSGPFHHEAPFHANWYKFVWKISTGDCDELDTYETFDSQTVWIADP